MKHVEHAGMAEHGMACILYADPVWLHHLFADLRVWSTNYFDNAMPGIPCLLTGF